MYDLTLERLAEAGFQQYEISNFARPGARCRHNLNCWRREDYLGFGAAAHSLEGGDTRRMNPEAIQDYLAGAPATFERLSPEERRFESLMLGLRLREGLDLAAFQSMHGLSFRQAYGAHAIPGVEKGLSEFTAEGYFRLTRRGMDVMNAVLLDFM